MVERLILLSQIIPRVARESVTTVPATQNSSGAMARWIAGMRLTNTIAVSCEVWNEWLLRYE